MDDELNTINLEHDLESDESHKDIMSKVEPVKKPSVLHAFGEYVGNHHIGPIAIGLFFVIVSFFISKQLYDVDLSDASADYENKPAVSVISKKVATSTTYTNSKYAFTLVYPSQFTLISGGGGDGAEGYVAAENANYICFKGSGECVIYISIVDNPKNAKAESFGDEFYPIPNRVIGGFENFTVDDATGVRAYNIDNTGGQIIFLVRDGFIMKIELKSESVSLDLVDIFEHILSTISFGARSN